MEILDKDKEEIKDFLKKIITNTINYNISKKIKINNSENLDEFIKTTNEFNKSLIKLVKQNNEDFQKKIYLLDDKILNMSNLLDKLYKQNTYLCEIINNNKVNNNDIIKNNIKDNIKDNIKYNNSENVEMINYYSSENDIDLMDNHLNTINIKETMKLDKELLLNTKNLKSTSLNDIIKELQNQELLYKDLKVEAYNLDPSFIQDCLHKQSIQSDLKIFKKVYIENIPCGYYSIRNIKKKYQYWLNGIMNDDDDNGTYIKDTISKNIYNCYLNINNYDNYNEDIDQFVKNQEYILNLNEQKYKDKLFSQIIKIIQIGNS